MPFTNYDLKKIDNLALTGIDGTENSIGYYLDMGYQHVHQPQKVSPTGADPVTLTAGGTAWTLGDYSADIVAANAITTPFDIHWVVISDPDTNGDYEIVLYGGTTEIARVPFTRSGVFTSSFQARVQVPVQAANTQIRAKLMASGGGETCKVKICYHEYT